MQEMQVGFLGRKDRSLGGGNGNPLQLVFFFFFLAALGFSLVAASGCYSVVAVRWLLIAAASLVAEHGL